MYIRVETDGPPQVGRISHHHFKGRLPYSLQLTLTVTSVERPTRIEADVSGDLSGAVAGL